jgi:hypothetical protein
VQTGKSAKAYIEEQALLIERVTDSYPGFSALRPLQQVTALQQIQRMIHMMQKQQLFKSNEIKKELRWHFPNYKHLEGDERRTAYIKAAQNMRDRCPEFRNPGLKHYFEDSNRMPIAYERDGTMYSCQGFESNGYLRYEPIPNQFELYPEQYDK